MNDDEPLDLPPDPDEKPGCWGRFLGPENAAGLGGWAGVFGPAAAVWTTVFLTQAPAGGPGLSRIANVAIGVSAMSVPSLIVGVLAGGIGSRAVRWVERRRGVRWPPWRAQFLAGFASGVLAAVVLAAVGATVANW